MPTKSCKKCTSNVTPKLFPGITCVDCSNPYHWKCTGLSAPAIVAVKKNNLSWTCHTCKRRSTIFADSQTVTPSQSTSTASTSSNATITELKELLNSALARIEKLESQVVQLGEKSAQFSSLSTTVQSLEVTCNSIEKSNVGDTLEVQNLPEDSLEDPAASAIRLGSDIGCPITLDDFSSVPHREQRRLRLSFKCKNLRRKFLLAGKDFNKRNRRFIVGAQSYKIHVNQELTTFQRSLFDATKRFANNNHYKFTWFDPNGRLLLKKDETSTPIHINSLDTLNDENTVPKCTGTPVQVTDLPSGSSV